MAAQGSRREVDGGYGSERSSDRRSPSLSLTDKDQEMKTAMAEHEDSIGGRARDGMIGLVDGRARRFLAEVRNEMARVTWPTRREVYATTLVVILTSIFFGVVSLATSTCILNSLIGGFTERSVWREHGEHDRRSRRSSGTSCTRTLASRTR